jgi:hypothetical protein
LGGGGYKERMKEGEPGGCILNEIEHE